MSTRDQILRIFPFLFEQFGFAFVDVSGEEDEVVLIAESGYLRFRFIQDRADFFLDVGNSRNPQKWTGIYDLLDEMKQNALISGDYKYANKAGALSGLLRKNFFAIRDYMVTNRGNQ